MRCGKDAVGEFQSLLSGRNPHECAVAKMLKHGFMPSLYRRNPHECAVAKNRITDTLGTCERRNPHECAVAKRDEIASIDEFVASQPARMRCGKGNADLKNARLNGVATRANALWQSRAIVVPEPKTPRT